MTRDVEWTDDEGDVTVRGKSVDVYVYQLYFILDGQVRRLIIV